MDIPGIGDCHWEKSLIGGGGEDCFYCLGVAHCRLLKNLLEQFPQIVSTPEASSSHVNILKVPLHTSYDLGQSSNLDPEDLDGQVGCYWFYAYRCLPYAQKKKKKIKRTVEKMI